VSFVSLSQHSDMLDLPSRTQLDPLRRILESLGSRSIITMLRTFTVLIGVLAAASVGSAWVEPSPSTLGQFQAEAPRLNPEVLEAALSATACARRQTDIKRNILSVIDYSLPSTEPRLWVFDLKKRKLLFRELVAHGVNTGENMATRFSNIEGSKQSSLGLFLTDKTYIGRNGYSLKLRGLEEGINHLALQRTIVMHGAWYVSEAFRREHGRLGRSWGCPAVKKEVAKPLIDTIKDGSLLFVYYPDEEWLSSSDFLNSCDTDPAAPTRTAADSPASPGSTGSLANRTQE
jgi:hypothetical protein